MAAIGDSASLCKTISAASNAAFAGLSLDHNPIHLDEAFAATTRFGRCIAHGMHVASLISAVLANRVPGPGTIYLSQQLSFKAPVFVGDEVTATVTVVESPRPTIYRVQTVVTNQRGEVVIDGEAVVKHAG